MIMINYLYRLEPCYSGEDQDAELYFTYYQITRESDKSYWIDDRTRNRVRIVRKTGRKRFAYPTKKEAFEAYQARARRYIAILSHFKSSAEECLELADTIKDVEELKTYHR